MAIKIVCDRAGCESETDNMPYASVEATEWRSISLNSNSRYMDKHVCPTCYSEIFKMFGGGDGSN